MEPTLRAGDRLLVDPVHHYKHYTRYPRPGDLVVARDPRAPRRWIVKRVLEVKSDRFFFVLAGDHPAHADDGEKIGPVGRDQLIGRPWLRYWPISRFGRLA